MQIAGLSAAYGLSVAEKTKFKNKKHVDFSAKNHSIYAEKSFSYNLLSSQALKSNIVPFLGLNSSGTSDIKLGCNYDNKTKNLQFGVFSKHATRIELYIFDKPINGKVIKTEVLEKQGDKWVTQIDKQAQTEAGIDIDGQKPVYYGYRAWGPNWNYDKKWKPGSDKGFVSHVDSKGNRFNPNKLLTDPYAREISHDPLIYNIDGVTNLDDTIYATGKNYYLKDSAKLAPKSIFVKLPKISTGTKPQRAIKDDVVYEVNVRGFTKEDSSIPEKYRGTYKGAALKAQYLKNLGVTMVEFLPVQEFQNDANDHPDMIKNGQNYWGYMTNAFFAPDRRYSSDKSAGGPTKEFKEMVKAFHDAGIKICLDVVYNHTGEGSLWDGNRDTVKLYSYRGLDNQTYYELSPDNIHDENLSGCGNTYNSGNIQATNLITEATKYWAEEMGIDAFRHDEASLLGNSKDNGGFSFEINNPNLYLQKVKKAVDLRTPDKEKGSVEVIAEPWGCADGTYQEGNFPPFWMEWCGKFRDVIRKSFMYPNQISLGELAAAVTGFPNVYGYVSMIPGMSGHNRTRAINMVSAHDGFTLNDAYSYARKDNNQPDFNSGGGMESELSIKSANALDKKRNIRNSILSLMISRGTPMLSGGDEFMRTQYGNNNPYNQDKHKNYFNWQLTQDQRKMQEFTKRVISFRKEHAALKDNSYFSGIDRNRNGLKDITWLTNSADEIKNSHYFDELENGFLAYRIDGTEFNDSAASIYVAMNKGKKDNSLILPDNQPGKHWYFVADTSENTEQYNNIMEIGKECRVDYVHNISAGSMMIFIEK